MASNEYQTPDLASVLRTLAAYVPPPPQPTSEQVQFGPLQPTVPFLSELEEGEYEPEASLDVRPSTILEPPAKVQPVRNIPSPVPKQPVVDATSITTWPAALRHVTKTVARSESIMARIRKLIEVQHQHECQWWEGRKALIQKQKDRVEGRRKVEEVLKAVGGKVDPSSVDFSPEEDTAELARYDKKVHRACTDMVKATTTELKVLGIPFFGIRPELMSAATDNVEADMHEGVGLVEVGGRGEMKLRPRELLQLQKRVLELLEVLCNE